MINTDEECLEYYNQNLKGKGLKIISLNKKCPDFINYIRNRFTDTTGNEMVRELIYRIEHKIEEHPKCPVCGKLLEFYKREWKYKSFCSQECKNSDKGKKVIQQKAIETNLKRYGCKVSSQNQEVKEKMKQTCLEKYGVDCTLKDKNIQNKTIHTWLLNYGVNHPCKSDKIKEKAKETCLQKYGVDNPFKLKEIQNKAKQTCLKKYGVKYAMQSDQIKKKNKNTCLTNYGVEYVTQTDSFKQKSKKSCLEKYGVEYTFQTNIVKEKTKETCLEKYGVEHIMQSNIFKEKAKETCLKKYGVEHPTQNKKIMLKAFDNRMKSMKGHSFSKKEDEIYDYLITIDKDVKRQYYSDLYPFHCDFYLPNFDVYIEYQGMWTHGKHPFNEDDIEDKILLEQWENKALNSKFYKSAIKNWTINDPLKRKTAKINKLNYLEIFYNESYKDKINEYLNTI